MLVITLLGLKCVEGDDMKSYISFDANEFYLEVSFGQSSDFKTEVRSRLLKMKKIRDLEPLRERLFCKTK